MLLNIPCVLTNKGKQKGSIFIPRLIGASILSHHPGSRSLIYRWESNNGNQGFVRSRPKDKNSGEPDLGQILGQMGRVEVIQGNF